MKRFLLPVLMLISFFGVSQPQYFSSVDSLDKKYFNWFNLSPDEKYQGASVDKAFNELLKDRTPAKKVIVAVIDGGVDISHPELQGKIWTNSDEIEGNGIDDDNNGYIDDVHGWNFIGGADGRDVYYENMEFVRILKELTPKFGNIVSEKEVAAGDLNNYDLYLRCKKEYDKEYENYSAQRKNVEKFEQKFKNPKEIIQAYLKKDKFTLEDLKNIKTDNEIIKQSRDYLIDWNKKGVTPEFIASYKKQINEWLDYRLNMDFDPRSTIVKDNPADINDRYYGNNDIKGPSAFHGTFVSGIIAANRENGIGIKGINSNAEIMVLRVVPDGDERDKDVALGIRYAVDNGANVINMSFGKYFSLRGAFMEDAIRYAEAHNVLVIHSAGNEADNTDLTDNYPSARYSDGTKSSTMITVGANTYKKGKTFCGRFSNYGKETVDIFAPGVDIVSISPGSKYSQGDGTSFSGPVVAGVAALVWSYNPNLTASQLKDILLNSADVYPKMKVYIPGKKKEKALFSDLCVSGGSVNAFKALKEASKIQVTANRTH
ncbi:MAG TPA: S8 family serine peptidase [Lentimicrobium sp.]|nr:S8 family serine peptidase [Lentimicrobium sp.]